MPNHVQTHITVLGETARVKEVMEAIALDENKKKHASDPCGIGTIDFRKIIPEPEDENIDLLQWHRDFWGTKWNAYQQEILSDHELRFRTAWELAEPVYSKLSELYPDIVLIVGYADEDFGFNFGLKVFHNGGVGDIETGIEEGTPDAHRFTKGIWLNSCELYKDIVEKAIKEKVWKK